MKTFTFVNTRFQADGSNLLRTVRWLIAFGLCLLPSATLGAQFTYTTNNGTITITGYSDLIPTNTAIVIPDSIGGMNVVGIGPLAFQDQGGLVDVTIPNTVTTIGNNAFHGCTGLVNLTIPDSVTSTGYGSFYGCSGLKSVTISQNLNVVEDFLFDACSGLTNVVIPNRVTNILNSAFEDCSSLLSVSIGNRVTYIGPFAFHGCTSLSSVVIPDSVIRIENSGFDGCTSLTSLTFGKSLSYIGNSAFQSNQFANLVIPNTVTGIGNYAFNDSGSLIHLTVAGSVTNIGWFAFGDCTNLVTATFEGNRAPNPGGLFAYATPTIYYLPGTTGWGATFAGVLHSSGIPPHQRQTPPWGSRTASSGLGLPAPRISRWS